MIKSDNSIKSSEGEPCWGREASPMVRFELADGAWLILPYCDLDYTYAHPSPSPEVLDLHFATHRVRLTGSGLRKIMVAMQKHAVEWVRPALKTERMSRGEGPTWITSIELEELQSKQSPGD